MKIIPSDDIYSWFDISNSLNILARRKKIPLAGAFEITARCNLACNMCYIRRDASKEVFERERSADEWIDMGRQTSEAGTLFLLITGGEPLLRPDFRKIYESLNQMGFILTIFTNGILIDENFIKWISKIPPNKIGVTLYGASPDTYKQITGNADGFEKTLRGIDLLLNSGISVELRTTITKRVTVQSQVPKEKKGCLQAFKKLAKCHII